MLCCFFDVSFIYFQRLSYQLQLGSVEFNTERLSMYFLRKMSIQAGAPVECLSIPVEVVKDKVTLPDGSENFKVGLRIGGGIDQDPSSSPFKCADTGIYITHIDANGAAERAGLQIHDKILQVNGYDFTMVTHEKAIHYIKKYPVLKMLIARKGVAGR